MIQGKFEGALCRQNGSAHTCAFEFEGKVQEVGYRLKAWTVALNHKTLQGGRLENVDGNRMRIYLTSKNPQELEHAYNELCKPENVPGTAEVQAIRQIDANGIDTIPAQRVTDILMLEQQSKGVDYIKAMLGQFSGNNKEMGKLNTGMDGLNTGMVGLNKGMDGLNTGMVGLNKGMDGLNTGMVGLNKGMDGLNTGMVGLNKGMGKLNTGMQGLNKGMKGLNKTTENMNREMCKKFDELPDKIADKLGEKFERLENKFDELPDKIADKLGEKFDMMGKKFDELPNRMAKAMKTA